MPWTQLSTKRERSEIGQNGFSSKSIIIRRSRYIGLYKRSRLDGKIWVVPSDVLKELDDALGSWQHITLNDSRLTLAARKQVLVSHGIPLTPQERDEMESIERRYFEVKDIMLFRRIADAELQLEHYKRSRAASYKPSKRKRRGSVFENAVLLGQKG